MSSLSGDDVTHTVAPPRDGHLRPLGEIATSCIQMGSLELPGEPESINDSSSSVNVDGASTQERIGLLRHVPLDDETLASTVFKKLHWRILPFAALIVVLSYLDRGNLGFVAADVCAELDMNHARYGIGVACFGVGYATSQVPSNYLLRKCGAITWFALLLIVWGVVAASFSFVQTRIAFYLLRFFLGVAEGGTFPGVWYFLTLFFPPDHLTFPYAAIESAMVIAHPLAAPIAAGLLSLDGLFGVPGWRLLFFVEGILPILYGCFLFRLLPPTIELASFLSPEEKEYLEAKHNDDNKETKTLLQEIWKVIENSNFWIIVLNSTIRGVLLATVVYWTTLIIDEMLNGDANNNDTCSSSESTSIASVALTAIPFTIAAIFSLWFGRVTTNVRNRSRLAGWIMASSGLFLYGWVILRHVSFVCALLSFSFGISCFVSLNALIVGLVGSYYDKEIKATALALLNTFTGAGMIIGPLFVGYIVERKNYGVAVTCLSISALIGGLALLTVTDPLTRQNLNLDDKEADHRATTREGDSEDRR